MPTKKETLEKLQTLDAAFSLLDELILNSENCWYQDAEEWYPQKLEKLYHHKSVSEFDLLP